MSTYWSSPYLLLLAALYGVLLWAWRRQHSTLVPVIRRRLARELALHSVAALCLVLALAGLQVPAEMPRQVLVAAADVSDSVFDLSTQTARLEELQEALDRATAQTAVVVFGRTPGLERALEPLAQPATETVQRGRPPHRRWSGTAPVDLTRPATVVDRAATDLGAAISFARGLFPPHSAGAARGILLLSDFRDTGGSADAAAGALSGSGVELLACPALLGPSADVHLAALSVPETARLGRDVPVEITVAAQSPAAVRVAVWRHGGGSDETPVDFRTVSLEARPGAGQAEARQVVRMLDRPAAPGICVYTARLSGPDGELPGDISLNNELSGAVRIAGASRWAVLTRPDSTLARLCADRAEPLGVRTDIFTVNALPQQASVYEPCVGILVDGLSAAELAEGPALRAVAEAVEGGKALVALGGERGFGAGGHRAGTWERLLPVEMTPEDDRTRSVLFVVDVSKSMEQRMGRDGGGVRKIDFAAEQLALAVQKLKPLDRLGLVSFSGAAQVAAPLSSESSRAGFLAAVRNLAIQSNTDLLPALRTTAGALRGDNAEEQLVVVLSDGVQTAARPTEEIVQAAKDLCPPPREPGKPQRTTLFTFGIGVDARDISASGEKMLKALAEAGGGTYSPEFLRLAERLEQAFAGTKKDFYARREPYTLRPAYAHPLVAALSQQASALPFRNRVQAKPAAEVVAWSAAPASPGDTREQKPDPILTLSGSGWAGTSRRAVLAVSLEGEPGTAWMGNDSCRRLLPALLEWAEAKTGASAAGWVVSAEAGDDDTLAVEVRASDPASGLPLNRRRLVATLAALQVSSAGARENAGAAARTPLPRVPLHPSAPGVYRALLPKPAQGVYRLSVQEEAPSNLKPETRNLNPLLPVCERFVTVPYPAELRRFGTDRAAMQRLVSKAGGASRIIEDPQDLARWAADKAASREMYSLRPWLIGLGMVLLLVEYALRGRR